MNIVFDHAIEVANVEVGTALTSLKEEVNYGDAYQSYGKLCRMLEVRSFYKDSFVNILYVF